MRAAYFLTLTLRELRQHEQARQLGEDTLTRMRRVLSKDHPYTIQAAHVLAAILTDLGEHNLTHQLGKKTRYEH